MATIHLPPDFKEFLQFLNNHAVEYLVVGGYAVGFHGYPRATGDMDVWVAFNPANLRICDNERRRVHLKEREAEVPTTGAVEFQITIPVPPPPTKSHKIWDSAKAVAWVPARAVASRTRNGEVIWILTTLSVAELPALAVLGLYRLRWQIELFFKRLKSLLHMDTLPSREGPTAKSWVFARLIAAALAQQLVQPSGPLSPWGYQLRELRAESAPP